MDLSWSNLTRMDTDDGDEEEDDGCKADDWLEIELAVMIFFLRDWEWAWHAFVMLRGLQWLSEKAVATTAFATRFFFFEIANGLDKCR